jgi:hypothetical protein
VNQNDHLAIQDPERQQTALAAVFPRILAGDGEVVPNGFGPLEVQPVRRRSRGASALSGWFGILLSRQFHHA